MEITKTDAQYCTNFCYFRTNGAEIVQIGVEITPSFLYCMRYVLWIWLYQVTRTVKIDKFIVLIPDTPFDRYILKFCTFFGSFCMTNKSIKDPNNY